MMVKKEERIDIKIGMVNDLICDIFNKSYCNSKSGYLEVKSYDKFEKDIFYLDCARFELEMILIKCGVSVDKYYDFKYEQTNPNDDEYRCFSYSFGALITIWKNFSQKVSMFENAYVDFFEETFEIFLNRLENVKKILSNNGKKVYFTANTAIAL
ncbi:MAG: hypothetical protein K5986_00690 [Clostridium sp.]|uniref:hypothetical protein n=1 Tax=Clostridium sp. DSM 8431 TaxID=1761781 RepID=UPI0008F2B288|nr:hypothetical protein [Clostridium sp. DSM 8431]MCR4942993.1 hypothetical protein [Clostridium sp.]SFU46493.1 hypothetical protein SAMN04487886_10349 [Clostridium sp. DSM 8431]